MLRVQQGGMPPMCGRIAAFARPLFVPVSLGNAKVKFGAQNVAL